MCVKPTKTEPTYTSTLIGLTAVLLAGCQHHPTITDSSRLDIRVTGADSSEEIENMIRVSVAEKYAPGNLEDGYRMYGMTNGATRWIFVQASNAPRGVGMFNLYCYSKEGQSMWLLRSYVPVYESAYTNSSDRELQIHADNDYVKVVFRGKVIFTSELEASLMAR